MQNSLVARTGPTVRRIAEAAGRDRHDVRPVGANLAGRVAKALGHDVTNARVGRVAKAARVVRRARTAAARGAMTGENNALQNNRYPTSVSQSWRTNAALNHWHDRSR
jgi:hypothetical protein